MTETLDEPLKISDGFEYNSPGNLALRRLAVWGGAEAPKNSQYTLMHDQDNTVGTSEIVYDEFDIEYREQRRRNWNIQHQEAVVFNDGAKVPSLDSGPLHWAVHERIGDVFSIKSQTTVREKNAFANILARDASVDFYRPMWLERTAKGKLYFSQSSYKSVSSDSLIGQIDFALEQDSSGFMKRAIGKSRERGEAFLKEHTETIKESVEAFPSLMKDFINQNGLEVDYDVILKRFDEVKNRIGVISYLDRNMPPGATGVYYSGSHGIFLNADLLHGSTKERVASTIFHELLHAVSSANLTKDHTEAYQYKDIGVGVPHVSWLNEAVTEYIARELVRLQTKNDAFIEHGPYQNEVSILSNILNSNKKMKKLLLGGYLDQHPIGRSLDQSRTNQAIEMIDYVYGSGFVHYVQEAFTSYEETRDETEIKKIKNYTAQPEHAKKSLKNARNLLLIAGLGVGTIGGASYYLDETRERARQLESQVESERNRYVWDDIEADDMEKIIDLNTKGATHVAVGAAPRIEVVLYEDNREREFSSPIYFQDSVGDEIVLVQDGDELRSLELGEQDDYAAYMRFSEQEDAQIIAVEPELNQSGTLIDARTGLPLGQEFDDSYTDK